jgi:putative spermidine/putrescine transport system substrate-binding protein
MSIGFFKLVRLACLSAFFLSLPVALEAKELLRIAAWEGYADDNVVRTFEQRYGVDIEITFVTSDDDLWYKINHAAFDVFAVNTAELQRYIESGLSVPIDLQHIPNHGNQLARFQDLKRIPGIVHDDKLYAVPYTYSEMGLVYNRKNVKSIPDSMEAMWDPDYRGRVLAFNASNHNFSLVGLLMGVANPFAMTDAELNEAARKLVQLRRNVLTFYATADEAVKLFVQYDPVLIYGNYGGQQVKALREAGADIGYVIPKEGALAWLDCWAMTSEAHNKTLAEQWINFTLEKSVSEQLTSHHGLANTITPAEESRHDDKIIWLHPIQAPMKRKALWDRIISGDRLERF